MPSRKAGEVLDVGGVHQRTTRGDGALEDERLQVGPGGVDGGGVAGRSAAHDDDVANFGGGVGHPSCSRISLLRLRSYVVRRSSGGTLQRPSVPPARQRGAAVGYSGGRPARRPTGVAAAGDQGRVRPPARPGVDEVVLVPGDVDRGDPGDPARGDLAGAAPGGGEQVRIEVPVLGEDPGLVGQGRLVDLGRGECRRLVEPGAGAEHVAAEADHGGRHGGGQHDADDPGLLHVAGRGRRLQRGRPAERQHGRPLTGQHPVEPRGHGDRHGGGGQCGQLAREAVQVGAQLGQLARQDSHRARCSSAATDASTGSSPTARSARSSSARWSSARWSGIGVSWSVGDPGSGASGTTGSSGGSGGVVIRPAPGSAAVRAYVATACPGLRPAPAPVST